SMSPGLEKDLYDIMTKMNIGENSGLRNHILTKPHGIQTAINNRIKQINAPFAQGAKPAKNQARFMATMDVYAALTSELTQVSNTIIIGALSDGLQYLTRSDDQSTAASRNKNMNRHLVEIMEEVQKTRGTLKYILNTLESLTST